MLHVSGQSSGQTFLTMVGSPGFSSVVGTRFSLQRRVSVGIHLSGKYVNRFESFLRCATLGNKLNVIDQSPKAGSLLVGKENPGEIAA